MTKTETQFNNLMSIMSWLNNVQGIIIEELGEDDRAISVHAVGYNITRVTLECIANLSTSFEEAGAVELDFIDGMKAQLRDYLKTYDPKRQEEAGAPNGVTLQ